MEHKYHYPICSIPDDKIFAKQCKALEKHIPNLQKDKLLEDVDGGKTQIYRIGDDCIIVHNCYYIGAVYVSSDIELTQFFC